MSVLDVAKYIYDYYSEVMKESVDELKLHKLVYLCQREKLALQNEALFLEPLQGWKHGPVSLDVRRCFKKEMQHSIKNIKEEDAYIIRNVVNQYASLSSWDLAELTHKEESWQNSRKGLREYENGNRILSLEDIRKDAEKVRPFDYTWGMYYDEFEDLEDLGVEECLVR